MRQESSHELAAVLFSQQLEERPSSVHELSFKCHSSVAATALLPWLASCTPQLSVLLCSANSLLMVPPLAQLRHLVLAQYTEDFSYVVKALPAAAGSADPQPGVHQSGRSLQHHPSAGLAGVGQTAPAEPV